MQYKLPELPYAYDALGSSISREIMELHHKKHHQSYVDSLNEALEGVPSELAGKSLEELLASPEQLPDSVQAAVRNHGGGHYNHSLFWQWMSPSGGGEPSGAVQELIAKRYGSYQEFVDEFTTQALGVFGSGWAWLLPNAEIITTSNQDTPMLYGEAEPILGLDVWEHAYYLDYKNVRADYVKAWWDVVDWGFVAERHKLINS